MVSIETVLTNNKINNSAGLYDPEIWNTGYINYYLLYSVIYNQIAI